MNITELARQLRTTPDELRSTLPEMGFAIGAKAIKVPDQLVNKIQYAWRERMKREKLRAKYKKEEKIKEEAVALVKDVTIPSVITVRDFGTKLGLPINIVIQELMKNGILANLNERIDFDTASILAEDLGYKVTREEDRHESQDSISSEDMKQLLADEGEEGLKERPPVVVVMGHVDHGKTALLDSIRKANVAKGESGGITQHIGAYQVEKKDRKITFIDTPGHEAFTVMRSRGARVADVAILVVAADDGVQPQTEEVIKIINAAKLPFIVALNKIDKPTIDLQYVKTQLSERGIIPEEWGGKAVLAPVSAKTGQGIDELLDMILLVADYDKDRIRANPDRKAVSTVIEAHVDKGQGPVATVLVQAGTLRAGDDLGIGDKLFGRVRAMKDWNGHDVKVAPPGMPVRILGFKTAPSVGDIIQVPEDGAELKAVRKGYAIEKRATVAQQAQDDEVEGGRKVLNVVLRADVLGSLEAIAGTLEKMKTPEVAVRIVSKGLGNLNDNDIITAKSADAAVYGFNVAATRDAANLANEKDVKVMESKIIYEIFDDVRARLQDLFPPEIVKTDIGKLQVLAVFRNDKKGQIIGGRVMDGRIEPGANCVLFRAGDPLDEGKVLKIQSGKQEVKEVRAGQECGVMVTCRSQAVEGDTMEFYTLEKKERKLKLPI
jgi:translation initiation factor IF-2